MSELQRILVTGATGKVGQSFIRASLTEPKLAEFELRVLCHNRTIEQRERLEIVRGSIEHREVVDSAVAGVSHVLHLATSKETPDSVMDVAIKGMFWPLEACRVSPKFQQFILVGGDAGMRPRYDLKRMADAAFDYVRAETDPRRVWYPG